MRANVRGTGWDISARGVVPELKAAHDESIVRRYKYSINTADELNAAQYDQEPLTELIVLCYDA